MKFLLNHRPTVFRFRRWSRKGYAAFCSLGKQVTIGRGGKSIADASLRKQGTMSISSRSLWGMHANEDEDNPPQPLTSLLASAPMTACVLMAILVAISHRTEAVAQCLSRHCTSTIDADSFFIHHTPATHTARMIPYTSHRYHPR